jgi:hypothetical protein
VGGFETRPYNHTAVVYAKGGFETRPYNHTVVVYAKGGFETRPYIVCLKSINQKS